MGGWWSLLAFIWGDWMSFLGKPLSTRTNLPSIFLMKEIGVFRPYPTQVGYGLLFLLSQLSKQLATFWRWLLPSHLTELCEDGLISFVRFRGQIDWRDFAIRPVFDFSRISEPIYRGSGFSVRAIWCTVCRSNLRLHPTARRNWFLQRKCPAVWTERGGNIWKSIAIALSSNLRTVQHITPAYSRLFTRSIQSAHYFVLEK
jgi:hypothetical protein